MSTTTEWPERPEPPTEADGGGARDGHGVSAEVRAAGVAEPGTETSGGWGARLIRGGATTEIPVHLLSRDGPAPVSVRLRPAVVGRRRSSGEQPHVPRRLPPRPPSRPAPVVDPDLVERPGRTLPGAVGVLGGLAGAVGGAASLWWGGVLPRITALPVPAGRSPGPSTGRPSRVRARSPCSGSAVSRAAGPARRGCSRSSAATAEQSAAPA